MPAIAATRATNAVAVPIYQTTSFQFDDAAHASRLFGLQDSAIIYSRIMNPTCAVLEERVAALEGGVAALAVASGQAAETLAILNLCQAGDNFVSSTDLYGGTWKSLCQYAEGLRHRGALRRPGRSGGLRPRRPDASTALLVRETLPNPKLAVFPIAEVASLGRKLGVPLILDNTAAPILCRPPRSRRRRGRAFDHQIYRRPRHLDRRHHRRWRQFRLGGRSGRASPASTSPIRAITAPSGDLILLKFQRIARDRRGPADPGADHRSHPDLVPVRDRTRLSRRRDGGDLVDRRMGLASSAPTPGCCSRRPCSRTATASPSSSGRSSPRWPTTWARWSSAEVWDATPWPRRSVPTRPGRASSGGGVLDPRVHGDRGQHPSVDAGQRRPPGRGRGRGGTHRGPVRVAAQARPPAEGHGHPAPGPRRHPRPGRRPLVRPPGHVLLGPCPEYCLNFGQARGMETSAGGPHPHGAPETGASRATGRDRSEPVTVSLVGSTGSIGYPGARGGGRRTGPVPGGGPRSPPLGGVVGRPGPPLRVPGGGHLQTRRRPSELERALPPGVEVVVGTEGLAAIATLADVAVNGVVGFAGSDGDHGRPRGRPPPGPGQQGVDHRRRPRRPAGQVHAGRRDHPRRLRALRGAPVPPGGQRR